MAVSTKDSNGNLFSQLYLNNTFVDDFYIGEVEVTKMYLGDILVYENKQASNDDKDTLYNEFTSTLFVLKEHALSYDEKRGRKAIQSGKQYYNICGFSGRRNQEI